MPTFTETPDREDHVRGLPLLRTPASGKIQACITSPFVLGCYTHYWGGRTVPCEKPDCEACNASMPYRWHGYLSAILKKSHEHVILEFTAQACDAFDDYVKHHGQLRGCAIECYRRPSSHNGRVIVQTQPADLGQVTLPDPPNIPSLLCKMWNVPMPEVSDFHREGEVSRKHLVKKDEENGSNASGFNPADTGLQHTR